MKRNPVKLLGLILIVALVFGSAGLPMSIGVVYAEEPGIATLQDAKTALSKAGEYYQTPVSALVDWEMALAIQSINQQYPDKVDLSSKTWPDEPSDGTYAPILYQLAIGKDATERVDALLASQAENGAFATNANDHAWAMITLNAADALPYEKGVLAARYLLNQPFSTTQGGFSSSWGPSLDATGVVAMALYPYVDESEFATSIGAIRNFLMNQQSAGGGYASFGTVNPSTTAYVVNGLCALGVDPFTVRYQQTGPSVVDALLSFQNTDGSFYYPESSWSPDTTGPGTVDLWGTKQAPQALWSAIAVSEAMTGQVESENPGSAYNALLTKSAILYGVAIAEQRFHDIKSTDWFATSVGSLAEIGIIHGTTETTFSPSKSITRAELVTLLANLSGVDLKSCSDTKFHDVTGAEWFAYSVEWARQEGIVNGFVDEQGIATFQPYQAITRQDLAVILYNYGMLLARESLGETKEPISFQDRGKIAEYALVAVTSMQKAGIINGISIGEGTYNYAPQRTATRAEAAVMVYQLLNQ